MEKRRRAIGHSLLLGVLVLAGCGGGGEAHPELAYGVVRDEVPSRIVVVTDEGKDAQRVTVGRLGSVTSLPEWSPDGRRIAFVRYRAVAGSGGRGTNFEVHVVNADGTAERRIGEGSSPRWTSDGRFLLVERARRGTRASDIYVLSVDGSGERRLTAGSSPVPSHRGSRIAFVRYVYRLDAGGECCIVVSSALYAISLNGSGLRRLARITRPGTHFSQPDWLSDDSAVSVVERTDVAVGGRLVTFSRTTGRRVIVPNVGEAYDWSPQGGRLAYTYGASTFIARSDGTTVTTFSGIDAFDVNWSPDGKEIALSVNDDPVSNRRVGIYVAAADDDRPRRVATEQGSAAYLDWRPAAQP